MTKDGGADEYEEKFMEGGRSLARSKVRIPWYVALYFVLPWLLVCGAVAVDALRTGRLAPVVAALATGVVMALVLVLHSHLRLTVTEKAVHVQLGVLGPTIPLERVRSCVVEEHGIPDWLAWGAKWTGPRQWAYFAPGAEGRGVKVTYVDDGGTERGVFVSCHDPEGIVAAVERARAGSSSGVRVESERVPPSSTGQEAEGREEAPKQRETKQGAP